jgi:hypothetical protein
VPLRIAFDLDGVLADMDAELGRQAERLFGSDDRSDPEGADESPDDPPPPVDLPMTPRRQRRLWKHVAGIENFWETLDEIEPGAVARLGALTAEHQWEIIFLTRRPPCAGFSAQVQSQRWLDARGFPRPSVYVVQGSRGKIAASLDLDVVVDDRPENCLDVAVDSKARPILIWRTPDQPVPVAARRLGIGVVATVGECLDILVQMEASARQNQPGVMDRVLRLLGLKDAQNA